MPWVEVLQVLVQEGRQPTPLLHWRVWEEQVGGTVGQGHH
jgi:hypothetical protein